MTLTRWLSNFPTGHGNRGYCIGDFAAQPVEHFDWSQPPRPSDQADRRASMPPFTIMRTPAGGLFRLLRRRLRSRLEPALGRTKLQMRQANSVCSIQRMLRALIRQTVNRPPISQLSGSHPAPQPDRRRAAPPVRSGGRRLARNRVRAKGPVRPTDSAVGPGPGSPGRPFIGSNGYGSLPHRLGASLHPP